MKEDVLPYSPSSALENLPGSFPVCSFETPTNYEGIATPLTRALENLNASHLIDDSLWRDVFALTGTMRTFYSADSILKAWFETHTVHHPQNFKFIPGTGNTQRLDEKTAWINISFTFETMGVPATQSIAIVSLIPGKDGQWKIWLLRTVLEQLKGCEDVDKLAPVLNELGEHNDSRDLPNGVNGVASNSLPRAKHFDCVVVGAGQSGLGSAGRLQALGVSYLAIDKNEQVGDNWLNRYDSARLHTIREYSHLPFDRTFSDSFQQYLTKYDLAKGYKQWVRKFDIGKSVWFSTTLESGSWDENNKLWTLNIRRHGTPVTLTARHVILAIGPGGQIPITPELPGRGQYKGTVLHSSEYTSSAAWTGKSGIVVGTANTAHDVAEDMVEAGLASTVMVQRRRTYVLPCEYLNNVASKSFNVDIPTADADRDQQSMPNVLGRLLFQKVLNSQAVNEAERFDALERVGFKVERYGDLMWHIAERLGGHYMDVGCSEKISKGEIKMKSDARITHFTPNGLGFSDGSEIPTDVIVFCTGFVGDNRTEVTRLFGKEVADRTKDFWGLDEEGELLGAFRTSGHPGLWFMGGAIAHARYFSRFIALQIKADLLGSRLPLYDGQRRTVSNGATDKMKKIGAEQ